MKNYVTSTVCVYIYIYNIKIYNLNKQLTLNKYAIIKIERRIVIVIVPFLQVATAFDYDTQVTWTNPNNDGLDEGMKGMVLGWKNTKVRKHNGVNVVSCCNTPK